MAKSKNETARVEDHRAGTSNENNSCRDMTLVTDGKQLQDGIIELEDPKTKDRYYVERPK